jgi:hypothetical protein
MKRTHIIITLAVVGMFAIQCKKNKQVTSVDEENPVSTEAGLENQPILREINVDPMYEWPGNTSPFQLISTQCSGDTLILEVQYGGGCETHDWKLSTNRLWLKSMPPKMNLHLEHDSHNDMCRALITEKLYFNLSPLKYPSQKQANFIVNNDHTKVVEYKY